jgi:hypothetical protein
MATNQRLENRFFAAKRQVCVLVGSALIWISISFSYELKIGNTPDWNPTQKPTFNQGRRYWKAIMKIAATRFAGGNR